MECFFWVQTSDIITVLEIEVWKKKELKLKYFSLFFYALDVDIFSSIIRYDTKT